MSKRHRGFGFAVVTSAFVAVVISLLLFLAYDVGVSHTERQLRAEQYSDQYTKRPDSGIESCRSEGASTIEECIAEEIYASGENKRAEYDLSAQQDMAQWAFWLLWVSVGSVVVTGVGVVFVALTLSEARSTTTAAIKATEETKRANDLIEAEKRPWLVCDPGPYCEYQYRATGEFLFWMPIIENKSNFPAFNIQFHHRIAPAEEPVGFTISIDDFIDEVTSRMTEVGLWKRQNVLMPGEVLKPRRTPWTPEDDLLTSQFQARANGYPDHQNRNLLYCLIYQATPSNDGRIFLDALMCYANGRRSYGPFRYGLLKEEGTRRIR